MKFDDLIDKINYLRIGINKVPTRIWVTRELGEEMNDRLMEILVLADQKENHWMKYCVISMNTCDHLDKVVVRWGKSVPEVAFNHES